VWNHVAKSIEQTCLAEEHVSRVAVDERKDKLRSLNSPIVEALSTQITGVISHSGSVVRAIVSVYYRAVRFAVLFQVAPCDEAQPA
jgi:hypothetical protein